MGRSTIARTGNLDTKNFRILVRKTTTYSSFHVLNYRIQYQHFRNKL
jgi:hypothetical protein